MQYVEVLGGKAVVGCKCASGSGISPQVRLAYCEEKLMYMVSSAQGARRARRTGRRERAIADCATTASSERTTTCVSLDNSTIFGLIFLRETDASAF